MMALSEMRVTVTDVVISLAAGGMRAFQVSPAFHDLPVGNSPNHNPGEFQPLL